MTDAGTVLTPLAGLLGGVLVGLATALLLFGNGKIAGISGIIGRSFFAAPGDLAWRLVFLAGLPVGAWLAARASADPLPFAITSSPLRLVAAGLLVGLGTQLANGCTSGHGVCGIARGSRRSLLATAIFMSSAAAVVFARRHVLGIR